MVRLIMGVKGSGKTKQLIELINNAAKDEPGNVVCIEANRTMTYDIHYHIRLIDAQEYNLDSYELFRGFISGLYAGNYDISHVFIDNLCKTIGREVDKDTENFLNWLDAFGEKNNIKFTVTISADASLTGCRSSCKAAALSHIHRRRLCQLAEAAFFRFQICTWEDPASSPSSRL